MYNEYPETKTGLSSSKELEWFGRLSEARNNNDEKLIAKCRNYLCEANSSLVPFIAHTILPKRNDLQNELISTGNLALMRAVDSFVVEGSRRFSTWAYAVLRNAMLKTKAIEERKRSHLVFTDPQKTEHFLADNRPSTSQIAEDKEWVLSIIDSADLTDIEYTIIQMRFYDGESLDSIGKKLKFTRQWIFQNMNNALAKMRLYVNSQ